MEKERIVALAQILSSMKETTHRLDDAMRDENMEDVALAKREILAFQKQVDKML